MIIAIDGPAASGKSTLALALARQLDYLYFDTGVMYRAVTLAVLERKVDPLAESEVSEIARSLDLDVRAPSLDDGRQYDVIMDGEDITWRIRSEEVDANVSQVSTYQGVREAMTRKQREIGMRGDVVMVGRDIGTVVLPEADLKIYLDASVEERARRRFEERIGRGDVVEYSEVLESMRERDKIDSSRDIAPLKVAGDAIVLDNTALTVGEAVDFILTRIAGGGR
jgi:cytidylate kinase